MHTSAILIRGARQLLTLHGSQGPRRGSELKELGLIPDGALLVRDGVITQVGPTRRVENLAEARAAVEVNAAGCVVMPGFVDSHTHILCPPATATATEIAHWERLIRTSSAKRLLAGARVWLDNMARHGTTSIGVNARFGSDAAAGVKLLRVLAELRNDPVDVIATVLLDRTAQSNADWILRELLPKIGKRQLARFAAWDPDGDGAPPAVAEQFEHEARGAGLIPRIQTAAGGVVWSMPPGGGGNGGAAAVDGTSSMVTLLPSAVAGGAGAGAPVRGLVDDGAAIALATGFHPSQTPALNMQTAIPLACMHWGLTAAEAICAATVNGAHAAGCAGRVGSLEIGKAADLLILNVADYRDMAAQLGMNAVHLTMKRGTFIYQEGAVAPIPPQGLHGARPAARVLGGLWEHSAL